MAKGIWDKLFEAENLFAKAKADDQDDDKDIRTGPTRGDDEEQDDDEPEGDDSGADDDDSTDDGNDDAGDREVDENTQDNKSDLGLHANDGAEDEAGDLNNGEKSADQKADEKNEEGSEEGGTPRPQPDTRAEAEKRIERPIGMPEPEDKTNEEDEKRDQKDAAANDRAKTEQGEENDTAPGKNPFAKAKEKSASKDSDDDSKKESDESGDDVDDKDNPFEKKSNKDADEKDDEDTDDKKEVVKEAFDAKKPDADEDEDGDEEEVVDEDEESEDDDEATDDAIEVEFDDEEGDADDVKTGDDVDEDAEGDLNDFGSPGESHDRFGQAVEDESTYEDPIFGTPDSWETGSDGVRTPVFNVLKGGKTQIVLNPMITDKRLDKSKIDEARDHRQEMIDYNVDRYTDYKGTEIFTGHPIEFTKPGAYDGQTDYASIRDIWNGLLRAGWTVRKPIGSQGSGGDGLLLHPDKKVQVRFFKQTPSAVKWRTRFEPSTIKENTRMIAGTRVRFGRRKLTESAGSYVIRSKDVVGEDLYYKRPSNVRPNGVQQGLWVREPLHAMVFKTYKEAAEVLKTFTWLIRRTAEVVDMDLA